MTKVKGMTSLILYKRNKDSKPVATVLAVLINNEIRFGWSKVASTKSGILKDEPSKKEGVKLAMIRAILEDGVENIPDDLKELKDLIVARAHKYFKHDDKIKFTA